MTSESWLGKILLILAYAAPVIAVALYIAIAVADLPVPFLTRAEASLEDEHYHEGPGILYEAGPGTRAGTFAPYFEIALEDGTLVTLTDLLEAEQPTFLYFWATT